MVRQILCTALLKIPLERMRVITPDVGGGFGTKLFTYREYALAAVAAQRTGKPVKWVSDRNEHFLACAQGRDNHTTATLALDDKGKFLALKVDTLADLGAYLSGFAPYVPFGGAGMLPGVYHFPAVHLRVRGVFTNTVPVDAYRGAGRPEAAYVIERLVDVAARDLGIAPDVLRRRNFIKPSAMPYKTPTGKVYDSGDFAGHLARAQELIDWDRFTKRAAASRRAGKLRGIGFATYIEACGMVGPETARLNLDGDGGVTLAIGSQSTGQGHATAYAQAIADHLGLRPELVRVLQGDTDRIPSGLGTGGSSSVTAAGVGVGKAAQSLADNLKALGADALETNVADIEIVDGAVRIVGTDRVLPFSELARKYEGDDRLKAEGAFQPPGPTYPNGTHMVEVEIDPDTGAVDILTYLVVDDFGATMNPLLLAGQIHGGSVQGIGQALMEEGAYDKSSGQLLTATLMDYALPRAATSPPIHFETRNVPCKTNPMGLKGAGEAGAIGSCPALMNAIVDALWRAHRIRHIDMPATPQRVWATIEEARRRHTL
jgi:carbon-monoxide dehydrogenase large subunit